MNIFWRIFPYFSVTVFGGSMIPTLKPHQKILVQREWFFCTFKKNDIVVLNDPRTGKLLIKRIIKIRRSFAFAQNDNYYWVEGDNKEESTDSRDFGFVDHKYILGKVIL